MNLTSTLIGLSIMGATAPTVMQMALAPVEAQARARNFSTAETSAVAFSAEWEGEVSAGWGNNIPANCAPPVNTSSNGTGWDITCWGGKHTKRGDTSDSKYYQEITRSFKLASSAASSSFSWNYNVPVNIGSDQCLTNDEWGLNLPNGFNALFADAIGACVPQVAWTEDSYLNSDPEKWQYDLRGYADMKGYATHSKFLQE